MREHFHIPDRYFLSHSVGCQPKSVAAMLTQDYLTPWQDKGGEAWPGWMGVLDAFRAHLAREFGTMPDQICPQTNVSSALTKILYAMPVQPGRNTILCCAQDFPTNGFVFNRAREVGFELRFIQGDPSDPETWASAINEAVAFVHITHAFSNTSQLAPVKQVAALARAAGAISIVDVAQSAGAAPIDLTDWKVDFAIGSGVKFLCCGPGAGYLYVAPDRVADCKPLDVGWFSHEDPFEMDIHDFRYAATAMRFFGGTPSPAPFVVANAALNLWQEIGLPAAQTHAQGLLSAMIDALPADILVSPTEAGKRGGTLVINPPNREAVKSTLHARNIHFDERREGFRFSVHGYTHPDEAGELVDTLNAALRG